MSLRLIVCGGRDFRDRALVCKTLDRVHTTRGIEAIIQGAADGADRLAAEWGWDNNVAVCSYPADWKRHGKAAGPIRNAEMIAEAKPDGVIAFPGGSGTKDMMDQAHAAGITVWQISPKASI